MVEILANINLAVERHTAKSPNLISNQITVLLALFGVNWAGYEISWMESLTFSDNLGEIYYESLFNFWNNISIIIKLRKTILG